MKNSKLMKASEWANREFTNNSAPQNRTIKHWILRKQIRGAIIDRKIYVYEDQRFGVAQTISNSVAKLLEASV